VIFSSNFRFMSNESGGLDFVCCSKQISAQITSRSLPLTTAREPKMETQRSLMLGTTSSGGNRIYDLPDCKVLTTTELVELTGISVNTLWRLRQMGEGPPRIKLTERIYGYPVGKLREWLAQRETA
jgi:predicted DNA-binding transcriptional regulator AlpA